MVDGDKVVVVYLDGNAQRPSRVFGAWSRDKPQKSFLVKIFMYVTCCVDSLWMLFLLKLMMLKRGRNCRRLANGIWDLQLMGLVAQLFSVCIRAGEFHLHFIQTAPKGNIVPEKKRSSH
jgi:hypothetical protein